MGSVNSVKENNFIMNRCFWYLVLRLVVLFTTTRTGINARVVLVQGDKNGRLMRENTENDYLEFLDVETKEKIKEAFWRKLFDRVEEEIEDAILDELADGVEKEENVARNGMSGIKKSEAENEQENYIHEKWNGEEKMDDGSNFLRKSHEEEALGNENPWWWLGADDAVIEEVPMQDPLKDVNSDVKVQGNSFVKNSEQNESLDRDEVDFDDLEDKEENNLGKNRDDVDELEKFLNKVMDVEVLERLRPYTLEEFDGENETSLDRNLSWMEAKEKEDDKNDNKISFDDGINEVEEKWHEEDEPNEEDDDDGKDLRTETNNSIWRWLLW